MTISSNKNINSHSKPGSIQIFLFDSHNQPSEWRKALLQRHIHVSRDQISKTVSAITQSLKENLSPFLDQDSDFLIQNSFDKSKNNTQIKITKSKNDHKNNNNNNNKGVVM